jgi:Flp pilus assembly protein TadD
MQLYEKALQVHPDNPLAANNLAYLMIEHGGNSDVALTLAQTARHALPNSTNVADTLAWVYYKKGAYRLAIDLLRDAIQNEEKNATFHYHLGLAYQKNNDLAKARTHLRRALELEPNSPSSADYRKALDAVGGQ